MFGFNPRLVGVLMLDSDTATVRREVRPGEEEIVRVPI
jgi:hypothetical protein